MLDITNIEFTKIEFNPEEINVKQLINEVIEHFYALSLKKHINLTATIDESISSVYLDPSRFKQVLFNYVSNALKFVPERGSVQIRILPEATTSFRLEVQDDGGGIAPEDVKKLFIAFQQLDASTTKKYSGAGLGLSLTKHIVEAQGGEVGAICTTKKNIFYAVLPRQHQLKTLSHHE
jgi:signal transduction histidine kinase